MPSELTVITEDIIKAEADFIAERLNAAEHMSSTARAAVHYGKLALKMREDCASDKQFEAKLIELGSQLQPGETAKLMKLAARVEREGVNVFLARNTAAQAQVEMGLLPANSAQATTRTAKPTTPGDAIEDMARAGRTLDEAIEVSPIKSWSNDEMTLLIAAFLKLKNSLKSEDSQE